MGHGRPRGALVADAVPLEAIDPRSQHVSGSDVGA
jgi:hypothetical protein